MLRSDTGVILRGKFEPILRLAHPLLQWPWPRALRRLSQCEFQLADRRMPVAHGRRNLQYFCPPHPAIAIASNNKITIRCLIYFPFGNQDCRFFCLHGQPVILHTTWLRLKSMDQDDVELSIFRKLNRKFSHSIDAHFLLSRSNFA